jgi:hypothetical protein
MVSLRNLITSKKPNMRQTLNIGQITFSYKLNSNKTFTQIKVVIIFITGLYTPKSGQYKHSVVEIKLALTYLDLVYW